MKCYKDSVCLVLIIFLVMSIMPQAYAAHSSDDITDGKYYIGTKAGNWLDIKGGSLNNGAEVQLWKNCDRSFSLTRLSDGTYKIVADHSGKTLEVKDSSHKKGAVVQQNKWQDQYAGKRWYIYDCGDGWYKFVNKDSGMCLAIAGGTDKSGSKLQQWSDNGTNAQRFKLVRAIPYNVGDEVYYSGKDTVFIEKNDYAELSSYDLPEGYYYITDIKTLKSINNGSEGKDTYYQLKDNNATKPRYWVNKIYFVTEEIGGCKFIYDLSEDSVHVNLASEASCKVALEYPLELATSIYQKYQYIGYTSFNTGIYELALEIAGHAILANWSSFDIDDKIGQTIIDRIYDRSKIADCGVSSLDDDAETVIHIATMYYYSINNYRWFKDHMK